MHTKEEYEQDLLEATVAERVLVVYNDHVNTFDHVIESLVKVCGHTIEQAEQCTYLIHYKGKCVVKKGELTKMETMCVSLLNKNITAEVE